MSEFQPRFERPLSPHLSIFRWIFPMAMSIAHRVTGAALYFGMVLVAWWLLAAAAGPNSYAIVTGLLGSWLGQLVLVGFTWALIHHALGGIRHLIWDVGYGYGPTEREWLARATLIGSIVLTVLIVIVAYLMVGRA